MRRFICALLVLCMLSGMTAFAACSHSYSDWSVLTPATDSSSGVYYRKCTKCGNYEYEGYYPEGTLYKGIKNKTNEVTALQDALFSLGYDVNTDGFYDVVTQAAVKDFQADNNLEQTGIAYPQTLECIESAMDGNTRVTYALERVEKYYRCGNAFLFNSTSMLKPNALRACLEKYNEAFDALRETHPEVKTYMYYVESSRTLTLDITQRSNGTLVLGEEIDPISPSYQIIKDELHVDECSHLEVTSVTQLMDYFYTTDHHWKYKGSYQGYLDCVRMLLGDDVDVLVPNGTKTFPFIFNGSSAKTLSMPVSDEYFTVYTFDEEPEYSSYMNDKKKAYTSSKNYLAGKYKAETYTNHYFMYYGADYAKELLVNDDCDGGNLLIIGSSYSNAVKILLTHHYKNILCIDTRHYEDEYGTDLKLSETVDEYDIDQILVLCDITFIQNKEDAILP